MNKNNDIKDKISRLFLSQFFGILSTQGDDGPHAVIVCFVASSGLNELVFVTSRNKRKFKNILKHPLVSLFIDNRSNTLDDLHSLCGVEVKGRAEIADKDDRAFYKEYFMRRFPDLREFYEAPDSALIKVKVSRFELIDDFQNIEILDIL